MFGGHHEVTIECKQEWVVLSGHTTTTPLQIEFDAPAIRHHAMKEWPQDNAATLCHHYNGKDDDGSGEISYKEFGYVFTKGDQLVVDIDVAAACLLNGMQRRMQAHEERLIAKFMAAGSSHLMFGLPHSLMSWVQMTTRMEC